MPSSGSATRKPSDCFGPFARPPAGGAVPSKDTVRNRLCREPMASSPDAFEPALTSSFTSCVWLVWPSSVLFPLVSSAESRLDNSARNRSQAFHFKVEPSSWGMSEALGSMVAKGANAASSSASDQDASVELRSNHAASRNPNQTDSKRQATSFRSCSSLAFVIKEKRPCR